LSIPDPKRVAMAFQARNRETGALPPEPNMVGMMPAELAEANRQRKTSAQNFPVPEGLITAFEKLVREMQKNDPDRDIRVGGWDVGNFGMPSRRKLEMYNHKRGGLPFAAPTGFTVEMFGILFDERGTPNTTGWSLVRLIDDPTVDRLWKAAKREADAFVASAKRNKTAGRVKTAGEVRFIKDRGDDASGWAWGTPGPEERAIRGTEFEFKPKQLKPLASSLRSTLMALGHAISASHTFTKIKAAKVSPDGSLGGKGYIQKIPDMRKAYMNAVEALSSLSDTIYDELNAPHWKMDDEVGITDNRERQEVKGIIDDAEEIREDPEGWAEGEESEMDEEGAGGKLASGRSKTAYGRSVEVSAEKDRITGMWSVYVHQGHRQTNVTGDIFKNQRAAEHDAQIIKSQLDAGVSADQIGKGYWRKYHNASASAKRLAQIYIGRNQ